MEYVNGGEVSKLLLHFILLHVLDMYVKYGLTTPSQGSKLKKSLGRLSATNWRNIVARYKF